ncbi:glycine betaine ABC transporter substrate-binding protein [Ilumatobacter sp.]|uniref:glycine betaine ABC transporter substrate-binding protein n=1 Tax=Ilumatobacter sp. TaxID=1967498 RepID=UPI003B5266F1
MTALGLVAVGCGDDVATSEIDLEGLSVTVGSKNFTEQYVLSEILLQALAANGAGVTDAVDTGDTPTTRAALEAGDIDAYFEYNSTGWVEILEQGTPPDSDGEALTEAVRELDADNGIEWLGRSTFNDTYGFAKSPEVAADTRATRYSVEAFDLQAMAEHLEENDDAVVCVEPEFTERADGLVLFEDETGYEVPDSQLRVLEAAEIYEATALDDCDFGEVFTTDGRIEAFDLDLVVDDGVFYVYNVSLNVRSEVYDEHADDLDALVRDILRPMSQRRMIDLNRRVSDGEPVADVAQDYLRRFDIV